ncbi:MAG: 16S rRNA (uracil(1498)-N(3))-methyltransferase [Ketobacteraceae bacterium]|nr:16S rRNA (uracil(1498)-N(3))-methyltransferase [Ketobacteraceae bacterium]
MNLILIHPGEWPDNAGNEAEVTLTDRRFEYIRSIHKPAPGDQLRVGLIHGKIGSGTVVALTEQQITLKVTLDQLPPEPSQATLVLALPRPQALKRILQAVTTFGVKDIYLMGCKRVEKSFWQTPALKKESVQELLLLGMEQAKDTLTPSIHLRPRFRPFVEDELSNLVTNQQAIVAHPKETACAFPDRISLPTFIAIGPEGGFIPHEVEMLEAIGFQPRSLGPRILKVETAVAVTLGRCLP